MKIPDSQVLDLGRLSIKRCREAFMSVGQLIDDDGQRAALLMSVAIDFVRGAAATIEECEDVTREQATTVVLGHLVSELGVESVQAIVQIGKSHDKNRTSAS